MKNAIGRVFKASAMAGAMTGLVIAAVVVCEVALASGMDSAELAAFIFGGFLILQIIISWKEAVDEEAEKDDGVDREITLKDSVVDAAMLLWICKKNSHDRRHYENVLEAETRRFAEFMDAQYETQYQSEKEERDERESVPEDDEMPPM